VFYKSCFLWQINDVDDDADVGADGLDSAGCSPKDDEDDDSDDDASKNCGAAAIKQSKISPAGGYQPGSSYYSEFTKQKSRLARRDDRRRLAVPSEDNSSCFEPSEDSFCGRYQRRQSDDDIPTGRGFGANGDAVMQRMMRRKLARKKRENAGVTTADSVAGYRGKDCSIEELIEYIDAKPLAVPKPVQKQSSSRKNRKKKRGSNRGAKSDSGDVKSVTPSISRERSGVSSCKTSPEKLAGQTAADVDGSTGTTNDRERHASSGEVDSEMLSELLSPHDVVSPALMYEGSSSNASDADNVSDHHNERTVGDYAHSPDESVEMSPGVRSESSCENYSLTGKVDAEPYVPGIQSTETVDSANVNDSGMYMLDGCCQSEPSDATVSINETTRGRDSYKESYVAETVADTQMDSEVTAAVTASVALRVSENAAVDSISVECRHSEDVCSTTIHGEIVCQTDEHVYSTLSVHGTGQSTPSSSTSDARDSHSTCDARDSRDFDSQSLPDDMSSDADHCYIQSSRENDFTVVTQKKKKNLTRQTVSSAGCLQRTFYNMSLWDSHPVHDWQGSCGHDTVKPLSSARSTVPVTCLSVSVSREPHGVPASQHIATPAELSESDQSFTHDRRTVQDADNVSSVACMDPNAVLDDATDVSSCCENSSHFSQSVKDTKQLSGEPKPREKVFLDTRRPNVGIAPASTSSELSFYYDVSVLENQPAVQTDSLRLSPAYNLQEAGGPAEVLSTSSSGNSTNFPTPVGTDSSLPVTCTDDANSVLSIANRRGQPDGSQSTPGDDLLLLDNACRWQQWDATPVDDVPQTHVSTRSGAPVHCVTLPSDTSRSSVELVDDSSRAGSLVVGPAAGRPSSSASDVDDPHQHSSQRGHQRFDLQPAQLFLYSG